MKRFGLIGKPISHSGSPRLFRAGYHGKYEYDLIEAPDFETSWELFLEKYDGINVTAPYKELACAKADIVSAECEAIGATNLLVKTPEGIKAYNSDYSSIALMLLDVLKEKTVSTALVVGCCGAGKAAVVAAMEVGLKTSIANRNVAKAEEFSEHLTGIFGKKRKPAVYSLEDMPAADIVVYTLPLAVPGTERFKDSTIIEANYRDPILNHESGKVWLLGQAVNGYELFTGEKPDAQAMSDALKG